MGNKLFSGMRHCQRFYKRYLVLRSLSNKLEEKTSLFSFYWSLLLNAPTVLGKVKSRFGIEIRTTSVNN